MVLAAAACTEREQPAAALTSHQRALLARFEAVSKFAPNDEYTGYRSTEAVPNPDAILNGIAERLLRRGSFTKNGFLDDATRTLLVFDDADTEDRDHAYMGVQRIMEILNIASSDGRLNREMYSFDPVGTRKP